MVLPTDTVYGIGADAFRRGRGRPPAGGQGPRPGHAGAGTGRLGRATTGLVDDLGRGWDLIDAFWPGGLTIVAPVHPTLAWDLGDTRGTVAVRMPLHPSRSSCSRRPGRWP